PAGGEPVLPPVAEPDEQTGERAERDRDGRGRRVIGNKRDRGSGVLEGDSTRRQLEVRLPPHLVFGGQLGQKVHREGMEWPKALGVGDPAVGLRRRGLWKRIVAMHRSS